MRTKPLKEKTAQRASSRLSARLDSDDESLQVIEDIRWPDGVNCLKCRKEVNYRTRRTFGASKRSVYAYKCGMCGHQFAATTDTIFDRTHVRLGIWFQVLREIFRRSGQRLPVVWVVQRYGLTRKTARRMLQRIQQRKNDDLVRKIGQRRSSNLDRFKPEIVKMLPQNPGVKGPIYDRLKKKGYRGGVTILRKYIRELRNKALYRKYHPVVGREWRRYAAKKRKKAGDYYYEQGNYMMAITRYTEALKLDPKIPELSELLRRAKNARDKEM